jgi:hypothetical protein
MVEPPESYPTTATRGPARRTDAARLRRSSTYRDDSEARSVGRLNRQSPQRS